MKHPVLQLTELNDLVYAEFHRITGSKDGFKLPPWWAAREREVIQMQCEENKALASARWSCLKRGDQQQRLLAYLRDLSPYVPSQSGDGDLVLRRVA